MNRSSLHSLGSQSEFTSSFSIISDLEFPFFLYCSEIDLASARAGLILGQLLIMIKSFAENPMLISTFHESEFYSL